MTEAVVPCRFGKDTPVLRVMYGDESTGVVIKPGVVMSSSVIEIEEYGDTVSQRQYLVETDEGLMEVWPDREVAVDPRPDTSGCGV